MIIISNAAAEFFGGINLFSFACIVSGLILICVEIFRQSKGMIAVAGSLMTAAGIAFRLFVDFSAGVMFILVLICCLVIMSALILSIIINKQAWLMRKPALKDETVETGNDYYFLLNLEGVAVTDIKKSGTIEINNIEFNVVNEGKPILSSSKVRVVEVEGRTIVVKEIVKD